MSESDTTEQQTQPRPPVPPLTRRKNGRVIAGVSGGIADRLGVSTGLVRTAFVILTFFGGSGIVLYIIGWLAIPEEGEDESIAGTGLSGIGRPSRGVGLALMVLGGILLLGLIDVVRGEIVWASALILAGILLYRGEIAAPDRGEARSDLPPPPPPPPPPAAAQFPAGSQVEERATEDADEDEAVAEDDLPPPPPGGDLPPPPVPVPAPVPAERRQRSILGPITLALMLIGVGVIAILDNTGVWEPSARHYVGALVGVAGLGLLVGAWWGRARALIAVGILLLPVLVVATIVRVPFSSAVGERDFQPGSVESVRTEYRLGAGELTIDLRRVDPGDAVVHFEASVGAGQLIVLLGPDAELRLDGRVGFGEIEIIGDRSSGVGQAFALAGVGREVNLVPSAEATGYFDLDLEVGFGQLQVLRSVSVDRALELPGIRTADRLAARSLVPLESSVMDRPFLRSLLCDERQPVVCIAR